MGVPQSLSFGHHLPLFVHLRQLLGDWNFAHRLSSPLPVVEAFPPEYSREEGIHSGSQPRGPSLLKPHFGLELEILVSQ